ncbi:hypothetical protein [Stutzerimonas stutzeri]|uniref:hypothetical protein n=1 Tax=Stutzerimonas stutzeri TaxID=316 RepID=UPI0015E40807|nr:hypothetical protein [Stutzerimonas stutzeri]MBA1224446.1 hypothetical protein [Stutzerimonas stutzeri]
MVIIQLHDVLRCLAVSSARCQRLRQERSAIALYRRERLAFAVMSVHKAINTTLSLLTSAEADADISQHVI